MPNFEYRDREKAKEGCVKTFVEKYDTVTVMGIHGIRGISKGYSGGLHSLVLYFDKNTII